MNDEIKNEYNTLVGNMEQLENNINELELNLNTNSLEEKLEEKQEELLEALKEPEDATKSEEQLLNEEKKEMNIRRNIIQDYFANKSKNLIQTSKNLIKNEQMIRLEDNAWKLLNDTNKALEDYLSSTLFYYENRNWTKFVQHFWEDSTKYQDIFKKSVDNLNLELGKNAYFKDIMQKYNKNKIHELTDQDVKFINIKNQIDKEYNGIIKMQKKGGRKTKKIQKIQKKSRKQRKSRRI